MVKKSQDSQEGAANAVDNCAHAHIVGEHVKPIHDWRPSDLPWKVGPHKSEKHCHNVQHNALQSLKHVRPPEMQRTL